MDLIVISPEGDRGDEHATLDRLFAAGLQRYHVRKPGWDQARLNRWLEGVAPQWRPRLTGAFARHWKDDGRAPGQPGPGPFSSRSCHDGKTLREACGAYDAVFFGPVWASDSKPGRTPLAEGELHAASEYLQNRSRAERRTTVYALSGITPSRVTRISQLGFDGVAVLGGVWDEGRDAIEFPGNPTRHEADPVERFRRYQLACFRAALPPLLCLTQDGVGLSHPEQVRRLCQAGAKWIQVRVKGAAESDWETICRESAAICRDHGVLCTINDRPDLALKAGAPGVHLGQDDGLSAVAQRAREEDWRGAGGLILGGTVNHLEGARAAVAAKGLDYVGVGPWRFTTTKRKLAPLLEAPGVERVIAELGALPAWVIGGVQAEDLPAIRALGAAGAAISSALYRNGGIAANYRLLAEAWEGATAPAPLTS